MAQVNGKYFAAEVQLAAGLNTVKAIVTYQNGTQNETSVTVTDSNQQAMVKLSASPNIGVPTLKASGLNTLDVTLVTTTTITAPISSYAWDLNGDGTVDLTCSSLSNITASFQQPGLYLPTVTVTDTAGNTYTATVIVNVLDKVQFNDIFTQKWEEMKKLLASGDIACASNHYADGAKEIFSSRFAAIASSSPTLLSTLVANMGSFHLVKMNDYLAECDLRSVKDGINYSFQVLFVKDTNGNWGILSY